jgi:Protein of unknown function (DUF998)
MDPRLGYPPGATATTGSWHDSLHNLAAVLVFGAFILTPLLLRNYRSGAWKRYSIVTSIGVLASFIITSVLVSLDYAGVYPEAPSGFMERVALTLGLAWMGVFAVYLLTDRKYMFFSGGRGTGQRTPLLCSSDDRQANGTQREPHQWQPETGPKMNSSRWAHIKASKNSAQPRTEEMQNKSQDDDDQTQYDKPPREGAEPG